MGPVKNEATKPGGNRGNRQRSANKSKQTRWKYQPLEMRREEEEEAQQQPEMIEDNEAKSENESQMISGDINPIVDLKQRRLSLSR